MNCALDTLFANSAKNFVTSNCVELNLFKNYAYTFVLMGN